MKLSRTILSASISWLILAGTSACVAVGADQDCAQDPSASGCVGSDNLAASKGGATNPLTANPTTGKGPHYWAESTYDEYRSVQSLPPFRFYGPIPDTDPLTARLQQWADAIDNLVRAKTLQHTGHVVQAPRPIIKVVKSTTGNAWVSAVRVCLGPADILGPARPERHTSQVNVFGEYVMEPMRWMGEIAACTPAPSSWGDKSNYVSWYSKLGTKCKLRQESSRIVVEGDGCANEGSPTSVDNLAVPATSPFVHVTSAMIEAARDEVGAVSVLVHELGHYYESHVVTDGLEKLFPYWFKPTSPLEPGRPQKIGESDSLEGDVKRLTLGRERPIAGAQLSRRLQSLVIDTLPYKLSSGACSKAAERAQAIDRKISIFGGQQLSPEQQQAYLAYETALLACAPSSVLGAPDEPTLSDLQNNLPFGLDSLVDLTGVSTLDGALRAIDAVAQRVDAEEDSFRARIDREHLGRYTGEQSADDFSLRWTSEAGVRFDQYLSGELDVNRAFYDANPSRFQSENGMTFEQCERLVRAGFVQGGETAFVTLGFDLFEPHHAACYRLFNIVARQKAERITAGPKMVLPLQSDAEWAALRAHAHELTEQARDEDEHTGPVPMSPRLAGPAGDIIVD